ncbi:MAG: serine/threonine protein kinase, partial [Acidobacteria bacterium]|nr:serine/threonine protein kinase [Acidobacteriota bacterium]
GTAGDGLAQTPGAIVTVAGTGQEGYGGDGRPATAAQLRSPCCVAVDAAGNLFISDTGNHRIRKIRPDGTITTVAGSDKSGYGGDGGPATAALLAYPGCAALDVAGNLFISDASNHRIRKVSPDGNISTVAGSDKSGYGGDG